MALSCAPRFTLVAGRCIPCCPPGEVCTTRILCKPDSTSAEPVPPVDPHAHLHDGLYLRVGLGVGVMSTSWKPAGGETQDRNAWGMIPVELAVGSAPVPGLTIGLGFYGALGAPSLLAALGPFVDIHPNPRRGFHLEAALTHAVLHLNLPADDCRQVATAGQCVHGDSVEYTGRALALVMGIGYEGWVSAQTSVGGLLRMQYVTTVMTATPAGFADTPVSSAMPAALFTVTYQ